MRFIKTLFAACVVGLPLLVNAATEQASTKWGEAAVVQTTGGKVAGFIRNGVLEFRGIPFGAPVGGDNRWQMPKPAQSWTDTLPAMQFQAACAQAARFGLTERSDNEDCLHLNVSLPFAEKRIAGQKRPVLVWIHGGGFIGGSSSMYRLDRLAQKTGAVVVTMNYRLGVFGFMPHPAFEAERNGGYALEDQRLALRWVQQNIAAFGGDPNNVTLAGESAGAASVCMHILAPEETTGLFQKAIVQSGACTFRLRSAEERKSFGESVAKLVGCSDPATALQCMRRADPQDLIKAADTAGAGDLMALAPTYGTKTLPRQGLAALSAGQFVKVPVLNGGTRDELRLYLGYEVQAGARFTADNYLQTLKAYYGDNAEEVAKHYPLSNFSSAAAALGSLMTDFRPDIGINHCLYLETAKLMSKHVPVYQWEFADRETPVLGVAVPFQPDPGFELGAAHSTELNAFFPLFSNTTAISGPDLSLKSQKMADQMMATWASFIRTGRPSAKGVPAWEPYGKTGTAIRFEPGHIRPFDPWVDYQCGFWKSHYRDYFAAE